MPTRFYFSPGLANPTGNTITPDSVWDHASVPSGFTGALVTSPLNGSVSTPINAMQDLTTSVSPADIILGQFVSAPLPAQTINAGTSFYVVVPTYEGVIDDDAFLQVHVRAVSNDGLTVRGTIYSGQSGTSTGPNAHLATYEFPTGFFKSRYLDGFGTTGTVVLQANDRIVVEVGARICAAASAVIVGGQFVDREEAIDYELVADITQATASPFYRGWIEFNKDLFPTLAREEFRFMYDGVLLNGSSSLPFVDLLKIDGLDNAPYGLAQNVREGLHGGFVTSAFETQRTVTLEGNIYASPSNLETYLDSLRENFLPTKRDQPLFFGTDLNARMVYGKSQGIRFAKESQRRLGIVPFQVQIICSDPRVYVGYSEKFAIQDQSVNTQYTLAGNRESYPKITMRGGLTNPTVTVVNEWGTQSVALTGTLTSTEVVVLDCEARTAIKNLNTNVRSSCTITDWPVLLPGRNNVLYSGTTVVGAPKLHLRYQEAYR